MDWLTIAISAVVALGGSAGFAQLLRVRTDRAKIRAEATDIIVDSATSLLAPFKEQVEMLRAELKEVKARSKELEQTLERERAASDTRIRQLESDIALRDRRIVELLEQGGL